MIQLPYLLQRENIARLSDGQILIGDRRIFPFEQRFEPCSSVEEVASALRAMVTQGGGPLEVAYTTLRFIAQEMVEGRLAYREDTLQQLGSLLIASRPTNTTMAREVSCLVETCGPSITQGVSLTQFAEMLNRSIDERQAHYDEIYHRMGMLGSTLIEDGDVILTTCFAEHTFLLSLAYAKKEGKKFSVLVNETRPYLQGSRLTYPSLKEMGIEASLITDGMGAHYIADGTITKYMTASDLLCMDGTVVNKVGTLANAIACKHYGVPYYAFSISPDTSKPDASTIQMEERDGRELLTCLGKEITRDGKALYPAFDIIPSSLVEEVITPEGVMTPSMLARRFV